MACNAADIPFLSFPRNEIIEVLPLQTKLLAVLIIFSRRSSQRATIMKQSELRFAACQRTSFLLPPKDPKCLLRQVDSQHQCQGSVVPVCVAQLRRKLASGRRMGQRHLRTMEMYRSEFMMLFEDLSRQHGALFWAWGVVRLSFQRRSVMLLTAVWPSRVDVDLQAIAETSHTKIERVLSPMQR